MSSVLKKADKQNLSLSLSNDQVTGNVSMTAILNRHQTIWVYMWTNLERPV